FRYKRLRKSWQSEDFPAAPTSVPPIIDPDVISDGTDDLWVTASGAAADLATKRNDLKSGVLGGYLPTLPSGGPELTSWVETQISTVLAQPFSKIAERASYADRGGDISSDLVTWGVFRDELRYLMQIHDFVGHKAQDGTPAPIPVLFEEWGKF